MSEYSNSHRKSKGRLAFYVVWAILFSTAMLQAFYAQGFGVWQED